MSQRFAFPILSALVFGAAVASSQVGCSDDNSFVGDGGAAACDPSQCGPGNECLEYAGVTECRLTCESQTGAADGCPFNYTCVAGSVKPFCRENTFLPTQGATGQWGAHCNSLEGVNASQCDNANGFFCQYSNRNDPDAFCTFFKCTSDADCAGGYYCGAANYIPPVKGQTRIVGDTLPVCLPRSYCAPCQEDLDCGPADDGSKQLCVGDANGAGYCTKECTKDTQCADEASCLGYQDTKVCAPIAGVCVGDGGFCSPCHSDSDCDAGGACVQSNYSTEKSCTVPSGKKCDITGSTAVFDCPKSMPAGTASRSFVSCVGQQFAEVPLDQCSGLVPLGTSDDDGFQIGCYARKR